MNDSSSFAFCTFTVLHLADAGKRGVAYDITILGCFCSYNDCGCKANAFPVSKAQSRRCEGLQASTCEKRKGVGSVSLGLHPNGKPDRELLEGRSPWTRVLLPSNPPDTGSPRPALRLSSLHPSSWAGQPSPTAVRGGPQRRSLGAHGVCCTTFKTQTQLGDRGDLKLRIIRASF